VVRSDVDVPADPPALAPDKPHSTLHGSIIAELVARASHGHAAFSDDNEEVYFMIEEATRSTQYAASIRPFARAKNGRGALAAIEAQFAGLEKWQAVITENETLLHSRKWKGTGNFPLEYFIAQHRQAYVTIEHASEHTPYQLPNEHTRVRLLLDGIETQDAQLLTAVEAVRADNVPETGKANNFEAAAAHLQPRCPVARKRQAKKRPLSVAEVNISSVGAPSIGKTGVHLRWHKYHEYRKLTQDQKRELYEWQQEHPEEVTASKASTRSDDKPKSTKRGKKTGKESNFTRKSVSKLVARRRKPRRSKTSNSTLRPW